MIRSEWMDELAATNGSTYAGIGIGRSCGCVACIALHHADLGLTMKGRMRHFFYCWRGSYCHLTRRMSGSC